jgi:hypothetical protein
MGGVFMRKKERPLYDSSFKLDGLRLADDPDKSDAEVERELGLLSVPSRVGAGSSGVATGTCPLDLRARRPWMRRTFAFAVS